MLYDSLYQKCLLCNEGYIVVNNKCKKPYKIRNRNCKKINNRICSICFTGYVLNEKKDCIKNEKWLIY